MENTRFALSDHILSLICAAAVLVCALCGVTADCGWGDDMAAYLSDGIAIAEGTYEEKIQLNYYMHPTAIPEDAKDGELIYSWGYPLLQSLVYKAVGFDRTDYHTVRYYKLPAIICLALTAAVLYLFLRQRFGKIPSLLFSVLFCENARFITEANNMMSDVPFMFFTVLVFLLLERFLGTLSGAGRTKKIVTAVFLGLAMWYVREARLNGGAVIVCAALGHLIYLLRNRALGRPSAVNLLPYAVLAAAVLLSERVFFFPATANTSDILRGGLPVVLPHIKYYIATCYQWFLSLPLMPLDVRILCKVGFIAAALLLALGLVTSYKTHLHYILLLAGTLSVLLLLPYEQGDRYLFFILPLFLLFICEGAAFIWRRVRLRLQAETVKRCVSVAALAAALAVILATADTARSLLTLPADTQNSGVYTADALDMYNYIQSNTGEDAVIASYKPRFLYLNTLRKSFFPGRNGHSVAEADYCLALKLFGLEPPPHDGGESFELLYSNDELALYSVIP